MSIALLLPTRGATMVKTGKGFVRHEVGEILDDDALAAQVGRDADRGLASASKTWVAAEGKNVAQLLEARRSDEGCDAEHLAVSRRKRVTRFRGVPAYPRPRRYVEAVERQGRDDTGVRVEHAGALAGLEKIEGVGMPWQWQHPFLLGRRDVYMSGEREMRSGPLDGVKVVADDRRDTAFTTSGSTSAAATAAAVSLAVSFSCTDAEDARTPPPFSPPRWCAAASLPDPPWIRRPTLLGLAHLDHRRDAAGAVVDGPASS
ncbi:hypothetical protein ZWY2020_017909 [Hordeum vulgare]|nr:hypothetical protein ZWY2020_017909 [Hordeum vulgare]